MRFIFIILFTLGFFNSCQKDTESDPDPDDCAGIAGGNNVCGCTDSTAFNYNSSATYDDGSCNNINCDEYLNNDNNSFRKKNKFKLYK